MKKELKIKFRIPKKSEYKKFARVENSEVPQYRATFSTEECKILQIGEASEAQIVESARSRKLLVATLNGKIIATMRYYIKPNGVLWVNMLEVLPRYQRSGVGGMFLEEIKKRAKRLGLKAIALEAQRKAWWAVNFYKKQGYKILNYNGVWDKPPFKGMLEKKPVVHSYVFGKVLK